MIEQNIERYSGKVLSRCARAMAAAEPQAGLGDPNDGGGLVLHDAQVRLVYWGLSWNNSIPLRDRIDAAVRSILASNYVLALNEYRDNIRAGTLAGSQMHAVADPANNFADNDAQALLRGMITSGLLPEPLDDQHLYVLVTPPGVTVDGTLGEHWYFKFACSDGTIRNVHYGWVTGNAIDDYSCTMAHELVESITDPEMDAITFASCPGVDGTCEIGDVCNQCYQLGDGTTVQNWYSTREHGCISPR